MLVFRVFYIINCHMEYFALILVGGQSGSEGVVD